MSAVPAVISVTRACGLVGMSRNPTMSDAARLPTLRRHVER